MKDFAQGKEFTRVKLKKHPMNCDQYELMIFDLPLSAVETDIPASLHKHVAECNSCHIMLSRHLAGMKQINESRRNQPKAFFYENILTKMQSSTEPRSRRIRSGNQLLRLSPALMSAAAAVV